MKLFCCLGERTQPTIVYKDHHRPKKPDSFPLKSTHTQIPTTLPNLEDSRSKSNKGLLFTHLERERTFEEKERSEITHTHMANHPPPPPPQPPLEQPPAMATNLSFSDGGSDEGMARSALSKFKEREEEIERKKMEMREKVQAQLGKVEEETKRLALIREELEALADPLRKEVANVHKRVDAINKELKPLGVTVQKKEREYKEALDSFNQKNKEKVQLVNKLVELVSESEKLRMKKLEELSKSIE